MTSGSRAVRKLEGKPKPVSFKKFVARKAADFSQFRAVKFTDTGTFGIL